MIFTTNRSHWNCCVIEPIGFYQSTCVLNFQYNSAQKYWFFVNGLNIHWIVFLNSWTKLKLAKTRKKKPATCFSGKRWWLVTPAAWLGICWWPLVGLGQCLFWTVHNKVAEGWCFQSCLSVSHSVSLSVHGWERKWRSLNMPSPTDMSLASSQSPLPGPVQTCSLGKARSLPSCWTELLKRRTSVWCGQNQFLCPSMHDMHSILFTDVTTDISIFFFTFVSCLPFLILRH